MFRRFAHWLLFALGVFVLAVLLMLMMETGTLGEDAQTWLRNQYAPIVPWYNEHHAALELAVKWIGGAFSAVFAVFAVYKSYYYAEFNLADRVVDFVKRTITRVVRVRRKLLSILFGPAIFESLSPMAATVPSKTNFKAWMLVRRSKRTAKKLVDVQKALDDEIKVLGIRKAFCETQRITAHLVQGLQQSAEAGLIQRNSAATIGKRDSALAEFEKALALKADDLDALQFAAREAKRMNNEAAALRFLARMTTAAEAANDAVRHARSLRFQAQINDGLGTRKSWDAARDFLVEARNNLEKSPHTLPETPLELARILELLGAVQIKREKFSSANRELQKARSAYKRLSGPVRTEGLERVDALIAQLTQGEDEPDQPTSMLPAPTAMSGTHINPEALEVVTEGAAVTLAPFTLLTVGEVEGGRAVISKDGSVLGRVEESVLRKLN